MDAGAVLGVRCDVVLPHVTAIRYVTPLREGGSLPGLMEADDLGTYVVKFRGAGQGRKALIAEVVSARLARACGLAVPDQVTVDLDPALAPGEPDQEVQDLLRASAGLNLGIDYLPGALDFDAAMGGVDGLLAGRVMWFDALVGNADRSWRNPNMLLWHGKLYLIDHGATLTFHHRWETAAAAAARPYDAADHALVGLGARVDEADQELSVLITERLVGEAAADIPEEWLVDEPGFDRPDQVRDAYVTQVASRLRARQAWLPGLRAAAASGAPRVHRAAAGQGRPAWLTGPRDHSGAGPRS
ncbi:MAG TPA: HipA family kinase [Streptosporangiaceae bacterium]